MAVSSADASYRSHKEFVGRPTYNNIVTAIILLTEGANYVNDDDFRLAKKERKINTTSNFPHKSRQSEACLR